MDVTKGLSEIVTGVHVLDQQRRSLENPNLPLNSPEAWEEAGFTYRTDTGESVTPAKAFELPAFWHAVQMISGDIAKLPLNVYVRRPDLGEDARERDRTHPLNRVLGIAANEETESIKFWGRFMAHALVWGNAYAYIERDGRGEVTGLYNLLPDRTQAERIDGKLYYVTETGSNGKLKALFPEEVLHIEGLSVSLLGGMKVFNAARNSLSIGLAQQKFAAKFFKHGGRVGGILELPLGMSKIARDQVEEGFRKSYEGAENPFKTVILRDSAKFHEAQQSPRESQMVEAKQEYTREIAHWFNLSPSKLGLSDSVSYNSKAEDNQNYLDTTLSIWLVRICAACNFRLLSEADQSEYFVEHNTSGLLRMNPLSQAQAFQILVTSRVMNPNECRAKLNMLPYDGGDEFVNPNTMTSGTPDTPSEDSPADHPSDTPADNQDLIDKTPKGTQDNHWIDKSLIEFRSDRYLQTLFKVTSAAREKSANQNAFVVWVDRNLEKHRDEWQRLATNGEQFPFDDIVDDLNKNLSVWKAGEFQQRVDEWCKKLETEKPI